jgi:hypothetical protein
MYGTLQSITSGTLIAFLLRKFILYVIHTDYCCESLLISNTKYSEGEMAASKNTKRSRKIGFFKEREINEKRIGYPIR